jgi:hypothetical protein
MRIWRVLLITLISLMLANLLSAQKTKPVFLDKPNQHSISFEPLAISYSYAHMFKRNVVFGTRLQFGPSVQFILTGSGQYDYGYGDGLQHFKPGGYDYELIKFQVFYRYTISKSFYTDVGPVASISASEAEWSNPIFLGVEASISYTIGMFFMGLRMKGGMSFENNHPKGIVSDDTYYALYVTPIFIGFAF